MTNSHKQRIAESVSTTYKQCSTAYGFTAADMGNPDMIEFVREDLLDNIGFVARKNGIDCNGLLAEIDAASTIKGMFDVINMAIGNIKDCIDLYGYELPAAQMDIQIDNQKDVQFKKKVEEKDNEENHLEQQLLLRQ